MKRKLYIIGLTASSVAAICCAYSVAMGWFLSALPGTFPDRVRREAPAWEIATLVCLAGVFLFYATLKKRHSDGNRN